MKIEIKNRFDSSILFSLETDSVKLCVETAIKSRANLCRADLSGADLSGAEETTWNPFIEEDLEILISLRTLCKENEQKRLIFHKVGKLGLRRSYLFALVRLLEQELLEQTGNIRAYKLVKSDGLAPFNGGITYELGKEYEVLSASTDEYLQCAEGINLATLDWCMREWQEGYRILIAEFAAKDIACIPIATDGKFRVFRCKIVGEKDLKEIGLIESEKTE